LKAEPVIRPDGLPSIFDGTRLLPFDLPAATFVRR
jgi:hypothetical protein